MSEGNPTSTPSDRRAGRLGFVRAAAQELRELGFRIVRINRERSSYCLKWPGVDFQIRLSDHQMSWLSIKKHKEIVTNIVVHPLPEVSPAIYAYGVMKTHFCDVERALARLGVAPSDPTYSASAYLDRRRSRAAAPQDGSGPASVEPEYAPVPR